MKYLIAFFILYDLGCGNPKYNKSPVNQYINSDNTTMHFLNLFQVKNKQCT